MIAANPCGTERLGITATDLTVSSAAAWAVRMMFLLFGSRMTLSWASFQMNG
jgi:hypothetical protein